MNVSLPYEIGTVLKAVESGLRLSIPIDIEELEKNGRAAILKITCKQIC